MALQEELEKQGYNLRGSGRGLPFFVLILSYIFILTSTAYPENFLFQDSKYEIIYEYACLMISLFGFGIVFYTNGYSANAMLLKHTSSSDETFDKNGSYSVVRHPVYNGLFLMWLGPALVTGNVFFIISFVLFCCIFFERIMISEEVQFKQKFGFKYSHWAEQIPAVIPNLHKFIKPDEKFNIPRAFKSNIGQFSLALLAFCSFDCLTEIFGVKRDYNNLYIIMFLISMLITALVEINEWFKKA